MSKSKFLKYLLIYLMTKNVYNVDVLRTIYYELILSKIMVSQFRESRERHVSLQ